MTCINRNLTHTNNSVLDNIVGNEDVVENPSSDQTHSYVSTLVNNDSTKEEVVYKLGIKMLNIGNDFVNYIKSFSNVYVKMFNHPNEIGSKYHELNGYEPVPENIAIIGVDGDKEVVIGAFPLENDNYSATTALLKKLKESLITSGDTLPLNINKLLSLISNRYKDSLNNSNPVGLSKDDYTIPQKDRVQFEQTVDDLKRKYGDNYKYIFSSPHVITRDFKADSNLKGRTVIFYNKYPSSSETVDLILKRSGIDRIYENQHLGFIYLNNDVYTDLKDLLEDMASLDLENISEHADTLLYNNSFARFLENIMDYTESPSHGATQYTEAMIDFVKETVYPGQKIFNSIKVVRKLEELRSQGDPRFFNHLNEKLKELVGDEKSGFRGIYINPTILKHTSEINSGIARVNDLDGLLDKRLKITGLLENVVRPQRMEFQFDNVVQDLNELLDLDYTEPVAQKSTISSFKYEVHKPKYLGREIEPQLAQVFSEFEQFGVSPQDLDNWVKTVTTEVLLNSNSNNFTEVLSEILKRKNKDKNNCK